MGKTEAGRESGDEIRIIRGNRRDWWDAICGEGRLAWGLIKEKNNDDDVVAVVWSRQREREREEKSVGGHQQHSVGVPERGSSSCSPLFSFSSLHKTHLYISSPSKIPEKRRDTFIHRVRSNSYSLQTKELSSISTQNVYLFLSNKRKNCKAHTVIHNHPAILNPRPIQFPEKNLNQLGRCQGTPARKIKKLALTMSTPGGRSLPSQPRLWLQPVFPKGSIINHILRTS